VSTTEIVPNQEFRPTEQCERVLDVLKDGRANPRFIIDQTGIDKPNVEYQLQRLTDAGWITKRARGLYEFVDDPRE